MSIKPLESSNCPALPRQIITPLCQPFSRQANQILDLYEMTRVPARHPGHCLRCFYDLLSAASPQKKKALAPLREWIEENLEIAISGCGGYDNGSLPIRLEEPDLESFCESAMARARDDSLSSAGNVLFEIRYKLEAA